MVSHFRGSYTHSSERKRECVCECVCGRYCSGRKVGVVWAAGLADWQVDALTTQG